MADDRRPHSRACGITSHDHGPACSTNCPTCQGLPFDTVPVKQEDLDEPLKSHEATKRVLYHVVNTYQNWRNERHGVPNEFTDDAVRIGEQHLREVDWFPEDAGWLREDEHVPLWYDADHLRVSGTVIERIDEELKRLRTQEPDGGLLYMLPWRRKAWREGVNVAKEVATIQLEQIRQAYVTEVLNRQEDTDRTYGVAND